MNTRAAARAGTLREPSPATLFATAATVHVASASVAFATIAPELPRALLRSGDPAHALAMHSALERVLLASLMLPPVAVTIVLAGLWLSLAAARSAREVQRWMAFACIPLVIESVGRMVSVLATSPLPSNTGELLQLPAQFSPGLALPLRIAGVELSPGMEYWIGTITLPAVIAIYCAGMALASAHEWHRAERARPSRMVSPREAAEAVAIVTGAFMVAALLLQLFGPSILRTLLGVIS